MWVGVIVTWREQESSSLAAVHCMAKPSALNSEDPI